MDEALGDQLLDSLEKLRTTLPALVTRLNESGVERTVGLRDNMGKDCVYYKKSLRLFLTRDYKDLRDLVSSVEDLFKRIEQ